VAEGVVAGDERAAGLNTCRAIYRVNRMINDEECKVPSHNQPAGIRDHAKAQLMLLWLVPADYYQAKQV
jgi:hypothetical protein